jgi:Na+/H+-dicarboxylate symporter
MKIYTKITIGLFAGAIAGVFLGEKAAFLEPFGNAFIRLITMVVIPLVLASLIVGTVSIGDIRRLGKVGGKTILYYLVTTAIAISIGLILANIIQPGEGLSQDVEQKLMESYSAESQEITISKEKLGVSGLLTKLIPSNPLKAMVDGNMLGLIVFALLLGISLTSVQRDKVQGVISFFEGLNEAMIKLVEFIMKVAPYGVFALIAAVVGKFGANILMTLIWYAIVVLAGLFLQLTITYSLSIRFLGRMSVFQFFRGIRSAQLVAFGTSSSNATLPVTMKCTEDNLGVSNKITSFVLPLGATINMDGTALYQGVAAVFIAQVYGISLSLPEQLIIVLTAILASIGAAGVPGAGVITLALILRVAGIPETGIALILGVDRILDMCRTVVNISGDAACATFIARTEGELSTPP